MVETSTPALEPDRDAHDFLLTGTDGQAYRLDDVRGANGTVVMFICNHCPYVRAIAPRLGPEMAALAEEGIGAIAIMPNDEQLSPGDSFDNMKEFARQHRFGFPYVIDKTQDVARAYGAVCTPDFFGFDKDLKLRYRGRFDATGAGPARPETPVELSQAMREIAKIGRSGLTQHPSVGCSIKWR